MNNEIYQQANNTAVKRELSHFGRFEMTGADASALLHHLTTNDIRRLRAGTGCDAALVTNKARLLDIVTIFRQDNAFLVVTSPNRRELFKPHAQRFVLFRQDIAIVDVSESTLQFAVFGPQAAGVVEALVPSLHQSPANTVHTVELPGATAFVTRTTRLPHPEGFWIWGSGAPLRAWFDALQLPVVDGDTYNVLRIEAGIPVAGAEVTEAINPWEAGLGESISLDKGCYNGQEIIARLNTYKKVKQHLRGLKLAGPLTDLPCALEVDGRNAGQVTSGAVSPRYGPIALAYVRSAHSAAGTRVEVLRAGQKETAEVVELPFGLVD